MRVTPIGWDWELGDSVVTKRGSSFIFPGEVVALFDKWVLVKAYGDMGGNYAGMFCNFEAREIEPYMMGGDNPAMLVLDPARDIISQMRAFALKHPGNGNIGQAQLHAMLKALDMAIEVEENKAKTAVKVSREITGEAREKFLKENGYK